MEYRSGHPPDDHPGGGTSVLTDYAKLSLLSMPPRYDVVFFSSSFAFFFLSRLIFTQKRSRSSSRLAWRVSEICPGGRNTGISSVNSILVFPGFIGQSTGPHKGPDFW